MNAEQLEAKYDTLVKDLNLIRDILHDAESAMIEETSAEGFASQETRDKVEAIREQEADADFDLYCFKQDNREFVDELKAARKKAREEKAEEAFEKFWNN